METLPVAPKPHGFTKEVVMNARHTLRNASAQLISNVAVVSLLALALSACGGNVGSTAGSTDTTEMQAALDTADGGMTTVAEKPSFADPAFAAVPEFSAAFADLDDPTMGSTLGGPSGAPVLHRYHVVLLWGHLPPAHDADEADVAPSPADWTGSVSVSAGAIAVKRTLMFEGKDAIAPRTAINSVSFVSHTLPHVDGMLLSIAMPASDSTLHFDTASLKKDLDLSRLATEVGGVVHLADGRNGLFAIGYEDRPGCAEGFVAGRWNKVRPALGTFHGRVFRGDGVTEGHVRGLWGHAPKRDQNVFFGKHIALDGSHRGLLGGVYGDGAFKGVWGVSDGGAPKDAGGLQGFYSDGYVADDGRGVWIGRWAERCGA
jgi:hypothetical protein